MPKRTIGIPKYTQTGSTKGHFKRGDKHPTQSDAYFSAYFRHRKTRQWMEQWTDIRYIEKIRKESVTEQGRAYKRHWSADNRDKIRIYQREHYHRSPKAQARNRAQARRRLPDYGDCTEIYFLAGELNLASRGAGSIERYEVDHYYPLNGKEFCGLHAPTNLQILTRHENRVKYNKAP